jgi:hypothetical protein
MNDPPLIEIDDLLDEIGRDLAAVEVFRSLDCEPAWRPELLSSTELDEAPVKQPNTRIPH